RLAVVVFGTQPLELGLFGLQLLREHRAALAVAAFLRGTVHARKAGVAGAGSAGSALGRRRHAPTRHGHHLGQVQLLAALAGIAVSVLRHAVGPGADIDIGGLRTWLPRPG